MSHSGRLKLAKGYVMHKMYSLRFIGGKHTAVENLVKGCILELRALIPDAVKELRREGLLVVHPASYGEQTSAVASPTGFAYANDYEKHYELPLQTYGKPNRIKKAEPLSREQLDALKSKKD